jgi:hypothetical protein
VLYTAAQALQLGKDPSHCPRVSVHVAPSRCYRRRAGEEPEIPWLPPEKGVVARFALRTLDFLFLQGTHALDIHLRFFPSSPVPLPSLLLLRPFFAGASGRRSGVLLFSMAGSRRRGTQMWGLSWRGVRSDR